ncbi:MAG: glycosyltransferase, partial [Lachnospiraceae bacterium]|nr:glycosyltransferase [Lachnospiraceae bacterium]
MHKNHTKKHIAIVVQNLHNGGAERMAANLSAELAKYYEVYLIVFDAADAIYPYGGKLIDLKVPPLQEGSVPQRVWNSLSRIRKLRYLKKRLKIDATISHMDGANLVNILSDMGDRRISVYHSMPSFETTDAFADRMLQRAIGHCSDRYLVVSGPALQDMHRNFGVPLDKLQCIYNFVDIPKAHQMMAEALPQETVDFYQRHDKVIVHAGRLIPLKAQQRLIRILGGFRAQGKNVSLVLLGEGEERGKLEECVRKTGVEDHVLMPGEVRNPFPYFKHADVFALCSVYDGLPMVLIEALACGCPVVSL